MDKEQTVLIFNGNDKKEIYITAYCELMRIARESLSKDEYCGLLDFIFDETAVGIGELNQ